MTKRKTTKTPETSATTVSEAENQPLDSENTAGSLVEASEADLTEVSTEPATAPLAATGATENSLAAEKVVDEDCKKKVAAKTKNRKQSAENPAAEPDEAQNLSSETAITSPAAELDKIENPSSEIPTTSPAAEPDLDAEFDPDAEPEFKENRCPRCHKVSSPKAIHLGMNRVHPNIERHRIICEHCKQIHFIKKIKK